MNFLEDIRGVWTFLRGEGLLCDIGNKGRE